MSLTWIIWIQAKGRRREMKWRRIKGWRKDDGGRPPPGFPRKTQVLIKHCFIHNDCVAFSTTAKFVTTKLQPRSEMQLEFAWLNIHYTFDKASRIIRDCVTRVCYSKMTRGKKECKMSRTELDFLPHRYIPSWNSCIEGKGRGFNKTSYPTIVYKYSWRYVVL